MSKYKINLPEVLSELSFVFNQYEDALIRNDVSVLEKYFWNSPRTVRYGIAENLYGAEEISAYRKACIPVPPGRFITHKIITSFGSDFGTISVEFTYPESNKIGRQMQTWVRFSEGWRIVAAHVSEI